MSRDERGRVPFALIGVLLLVSSATIAATNQPRAPAAEPSVSKATDRAVADAHAAIRGAVAHASRDAARAPVVERANTSAGRALNASTAFRDALRIRIYLEARERLGQIERRRGDVTVVSALPPVSDVDDLKRAKRRVRIERADENGTALRVRIENVTVAASRDGRVVTRRSLSPSLVVGTPVLALHDRVTAYQDRLDAGVTEPGLDRRVTAQLYGIAWARGYAQYVGAPVDDVVANRHVALAANAGLLDVQRATIGRADSDGRRTLALAAAKTAGSDLLGASGADAPRVRDALDAPTKPIEGVGHRLDSAGADRRRENLTVAVNRTADDALLGIVRDGTLNESMSDVYSADVRLVASVKSVAGGRPSTPAAPGPNWTLVEEDRSSEVRVSNSRGPPLSIPGGWHRLETYRRSIAVERTRTGLWRRGNETRRTISRDTETVRASVAVVGRHATSDRAPARGIRTAHERGAGPFDGPNLADVRSLAVRRLVRERGGPDAVLGRAATGTLDADVERVRARRPDGLSQWVYRDLMAVRERVRSTRVAVSREEVGTFEANPPALLAERIRERRSALLDAPETYADVASKARVAARAAYLDEVLRRLDDRAASRRERGRRFGAFLGDRGLGSLADLRDDAGAAVEPPPERRTALDGPAGPVRLRVDGAPSYLTRAELTRDEEPALEARGHPLVARNINLFTVPYGDAADAVVDGVFGSGERVRLATAARTLRAANATLERRTDPAVRERRDELAGSVTDGTGSLERELRLTLAMRGVGETASDRRDVVDAGLDRWETADARALALTNGSASAAVAAAAAERESLSSTRRDRLRLELDSRVRTALTSDAVQPRRGPVNRSRRVTRDLANELVTEAASRATERGVEALANESFDRVPAGLPLAPPLSAWYATTNVWHVTVRGEYARFGVRADRGRPRDPGAELAYVRDGSVVTLDVDGDGERERLGRAARVDIDVSTTVVVVVPPGKSGVGDRDGNADERSGGWPDPGPG